MPTLYRCRTALSEVATRFNAQAPARAVWSADLWPGRTGLIIREEEGVRIIEAMAWGMPPALGLSGPGFEPRTTLWFREWLTAEAPLHAPAHRCLIIADSFAYPAGPVGAKTRTWYGFDDPPVFAWAGLWRARGNTRGYCGFHVASAEPVHPGRVMPAIVAPDNYALWLGGPLRGADRIVRTSKPQPDMYREATDEPWGPDRTP